MRIDGETWTARSYFDGEEIAAGTRVEVVEVKGVTALVIASPSPQEISEQGERQVIELIGAVVVVLLLMVVASRTVRIVRQSYVGIVERLGRFQRTLQPGVHVLMPFLDRMRMVVDMKETVQPFAPQPVITEDNVTIGVDTVVYYQVTDAVKATYEVANVLVAMEQLTITTLRNVVGAMTLEQTLTSRDQINSQLRSVLDEATEKWGVRVTRVELKSIDPPRSIQEAMEQQMRADRAKRATVLQAEGEKQSAILRAEGSRQAAILNAEADQKSNILRAEGDRQARALRAQGEAEALEKDLQDGRRLRDPARRHARLQVPGGAAGGGGGRRQQAAAPAHRRRQRDGRRGRAGGGFQRGRNVRGGRRACSSASSEAARPGRRRQQQRLLTRSAPRPRSCLYNPAPLVTAPLRQLRMWAAAALCAAGVLVLTAAPAIADVATPVHPDSTNADAIDDIYRAALGVTVTIFVLVGGWLLYTAVRFRERKGEVREDPPQVHGSTRLEIGWTVVPVLILVGLAGYTFYKLPAAENIPTPPNALVIHISAAQFAFSYTYPNGKGPSQPSTLVVPVNTPVEVDLTSKDVNHDWWVPALAPKVDAIPGQVNHTGFTATAVGLYHGRCAEFCGVGHATMTILVQVVSKPAFQRYMARLK